MDTIVLTTANSKTSEPHKFSYKLTNSMRLDNYYLCLSNLSMYYTWKNIKAAYGNNTFIYSIDGRNNIPVTLEDGSYSVEDINHYLHHKMGVMNTYPISIYANSVYNRVSVALHSTRCRLLLSPGLATILGFSNRDITRSSHGDLPPKLERVETVLVHCNLAQNNFTKDSSLIYSFVPSNEYGTQLHEKPNYALWRPVRQHSDIREIDIYFTDQLYRPIELEDNVLVEIQLKPRNLTL